MAKAIKTTIYTVQGQTVNVDKLVERTHRTVKVGDYLYARKVVRGQQVFFYGRVDMVSGGGSVVLSFGSYGQSFEARVPAKCTVYRPL